MSDLNTEIRQEFKDLESKLRDIEYTFCHLNSINKKQQKLIDAALEMARKINQEIPCFKKYRDYAREFLASDLVKEYKGE